MKLTGERPMEGATPDSLLALHDAGYREVVARLGPGRRRRHRLWHRRGDRAAHRARSARDRRRLQQRHRPARRAYLRRARPGLDFFASDGAVLGLRDRSVDYAVSSHIIEHFVNPALHVIELARVLRADGTAFVITPNAPADFENPFHVYLFEPEHLVSLLSLFFDDVRVLRPRRRRSAQGRLRDAPRERRAAPEARPAQPAPQDAARRVRVGLRARAPAHLPRPRARQHRHRLGHRRSRTSSSAKTCRRDTPVLFAVARRPRASHG